MSLAQVLYFWANWLSELAALRSTTTTIITTTTTTAAAATTTTKVKY